MQLIKNNQPLNTGAVVHFNNKPFFIFSTDQASGYLSIIGMMDREFKTVFPSQIGATWSR